MGSYSLTYRLGVTLTLLVSVVALVAAITLGLSSLLILGIVVGLVTLKAQDAVPWPRVAQSSALTLMLCCAALLMASHFSEQPKQEGVALTAASASSGSSSTPSNPTLGVSPGALPASSQVHGKSSSLGKLSEPTGVNRQGPQPKASAASPQQSVGQGEVDDTSGKVKEIRDQLKELKEGINQTVTVWSILIAVLTVVLGFVTSWVIGIAKEAKDQVAQLYESGRVRNLLQQNQQETLRQAIWLEVNQQLKIAIDDAGGMPRYQFLLQLKRVLIAAPTLHDPFGLPEVSRKLENCLEPAQNIASKELGILNSEDLRYLRERMLRWLTLEHQLVQDLPHMRGAEGGRALDLLGGWVRLLRSR